MSVEAFKGIIGHERVLQILERAAQKPAPAYLFSGPEGVGKSTVAMRFARLLLGVPANASLEAHPDFIRVAREEDAKELTIKQARELIKRLQLTSAHGGRRVAFIEQADRWNEEAANALLKAVEEPPAGAVYCFISEQPESLPATLRSRLTVLPFGRVAESVMRDWLKEQNVPADQLERAIAYSRGCPGRAARFLENIEEIEREGEQVKRTLRMLQGSPLGACSAELERTGRALEGEEDSERAWRQWLALAMQGLEKSFTERPAQTVDLALGLVHAWKLAGTTLSPRLALEWALARPYLNDRKIPSFLYPSYL